MAEYFIFSFLTMSMFYIVMCVDDMCHAKDE